MATKRAIMKLRQKFSVAINLSFATQYRLSECVLDSLYYRNKHMMVPCNIYLTRKAVKIIYFFTPPIVSFFSKFYKSVDHKSFN